MVPAIALQLVDGADGTVCSECGENAGCASGLALVRSEPEGRLCQACARRHAPALAALLDLAGTADRVSRITRHGVFPPLTSLLALARAAEDFTSASGSHRRQD